MSDLTETITKHWVDVVGLLVYLALTFGYYAAFTVGMRVRPYSLLHGRMNWYRHRWIHMVYARRDGMLAVQTCRNQLQTATFLASTAIIVDVGLLTLLGLPRETTSFLLHGNVGDKAAEMWLFLKVVIMIGLYSYNFLSFAVCIRDLNYFGYLIALYGSDDESEEPGVLAHLEDLIDRVALNYTRGLRGYFFGLPLFFWLLSPYLMILVSIIILGLLWARDHSHRNLPPPPVGPVGRSRDEAE